MIPASNKSSTGTAVDICSDYLCGLCPYDLFKNTDADKGSCPKVHSDETRRVYIETLSSKPQISVNKEHLRSLEATLAARDLKVEKAKHWICPPLDDSDETKKMKDRIEKLEQDISKYELRRDISHQDYAVQRGLIKNQSKLCIQLQRTLESQSSAKQYQLRICQVCGCYVDENISGERKYLHEKSNGIHDAYVKIAAKVAAIKNEK